jgi:tetratricopeptide (TPR) repeat protein
MIIVLIFCLAILTASCANPLNRATSIRYGNECSDAESRGKLDIAEQACYRALVNVDWGNLGDEEKSIRMYDLARIKRKLGKYDEAEKLYKDSLSIEESKPQPSNEKIGRRLAELAILYEQKGQIRNGLPYVQKLFSLADQYEGSEKKVVAAIFYVYSLKLKIEEPKDLILKLADKAAQMGFTAKDLDR